jgi:hypothetical protein
MRPRLRGTGVWLGFCGSLVLAIAVVGCGDTIPPTAEPGGFTGPEIQRAKTAATPLAQGATAMSGTAPTNGVPIPAAPTASAPVCAEGAACTVVGAKCNDSGRSQLCTCQPAEPGDPSPTLSCE